MPAEMPQPDARQPNRVRIRLKHSLAAGLEINVMMPDRLEEFDAAYAQGELMELRAKLDDDVGNA
jgi:hypothetical protein